MRKLCLVFIVMTAVLVNAPIFADGSDACPFPISDKQMNLVIRTADKSASSLRHLERLLDEMETVFERDEKETTSYITSIKMRLEYLIYRLNTIDENCSFARANWIAYCQWQEPQTEMSADKQSTRTAARTNTIPSVRSFEEVLVDIKAEAIKSVSALILFDIASDKILKILATIDAWPADNFFYFLVGTNVKDQFTLRSLSNNISYYYYYSDCEGGCG